MRVRIRVRVTVRAGATFADVFGILLPHFVIPLMALNLQRTNRVNLQRTNRVRLGVGLVRFRVRCRDVDLRF